MRLFALRRPTFCHLVAPYHFRAHIPLRTQAYENGSAIEHLASGAATTAWLYDVPRIQSEHQVTVANPNLVKLVQEARYGAADRLRLQMQENGVEIQRHPVYRKAALAALQWDDPEISMDLFSSWFSLLPNINESKSAPRLNPIVDIRNAILRSGAPAERRSLVKQFALMCASKGYGRHIYSEVVNLITRFATPSEGARFLLLYEMAVRQYYQQISPGPSQAPAKRCRIAAVEICCQVGWLDEALEILQLQRDFALPDHTYKLLLYTLQARQRLGEVALVEELRLRDKSQLSTTGHLHSHSHSQSHYTPLPSAYDTQSFHASTRPPLPNSKPISISRTSVAAQPGAIIKSPSNGMLGWAYARAGDVDNAMRVLIDIERWTEENGKDNQVLRQLVAYRRVIKGFMQAGLIDQAHEIEKRMRRKVAYTRGLNRQLDRVLDWLSSRLV